MFMLSVDLDIEKVAAQSKQTLATLNHCAAGLRAFPLPSPAFARTILRVRLRLDPAESYLPHALPSEYAAPLTSVPLQPTSHSSRSPP